MDIVRETAISEVEKGLFLLDKEIEKNAVVILSSCKLRIIKMLKKIKEYQQNGDIGKIGSILFVQSRVEIDNGNFIYPVFIYGEKMYIDEYCINFKLDVSFFYHFLQDIKEKILLTAKKHVYENVSMPIVEREVYRQLKYFNMYVVIMLRKVFLEEDTSSLMEQLDKTDGFVVLQNEIYEQPYLIFETDSRGV